MTQPQITLCAILAATVVLFAWGRWRHDMVALAALLVAVFAGLVPADRAFYGFGHPAVITVACVLVLSRGLQTSGVVDMVAQRLLPTEARPVTMIAGLTAMAALLSGFMNNVGALALLMPIALKAAARLEMPPGRLLMPVAFGSILGGMTTLIGTPPNLIVSGYRAQTVGAPFAMFDFTPVGLAIALAGVVFITLIGWHLVPARKRAGVEGFEAGAYLTEARVPEGARAVGMTLREVENAAEGVEVQVLGLIRRDVRLRAPRFDTKVRAEDIIVLEAEPDGLSNALTTLGIRIDEAAPEDEENAPDAPDEDRPRDEGDVVLSELVVPPGASLIGRTASALNFRTRYQINLLAISREGRRAIGRLRTTRLAAGDVLLVQGSPEAISELASDYRCLPLAERPLRLPDRKGMVLAGGILLGAVALAASGALPAPVAFATGFLAALVTRVVPPRAAYDAIDWPVIVLLACLLPVADAMLTTGTAEVLAQALVSDLAQGAPVLALALILIATMTLSDVMNNAATVAVMAPIGYGAALALEVDPDAYFMAVAIGGSCAFLTPIGHQNNTLILGPGGFRFGDYWRLGLPLEILVVAVAVPMILLVWGL